MEQAQEADMDPATIAASVAALLTPYLKKAGEEFAGEAGKFVQEKARLLWQKLRAKLDGKPPAKEVLDSFEKDPAAHADDFTETVAATVAADKPLAVLLPGRHQQQCRIGTLSRDRVMVAHRHGDVGLERFVQRIDQRAICQNVLDVVGRDDAHGARP